MPPKKPRRKKRTQILIPHSLTIGEHEYRVLWLRDLQKGIYGLCTQGEPRVIVISTTQEPSEVLPTLVHEALHAIEFEYGVQLGHKKIRKLEYALAQLILQIVEKSTS